MSSEQLAAAEKAGDEISPEERAKRKRFHERLGALRSMNKTLAAVQKKARLEGKSSKGRVHKSKFVALKITVLLNMMLEMRDLPLTVVHRIFCHDRRCRKYRTSLLKEYQRPVHNIHDEDRAKAADIRKEIGLLFDLDEFIADPRNQ
jgi:hypothetical protein